METNLRILQSTCTVFSSYISMNYSKISLTHVYKIFNVKHKKILVNNCVKQIQMFGSWYPIYLFNLT